VHTAYTLRVKKGATLTIAITCQFLVDLQNSFTAAKSSKFPTKPVLGYPPHLKCIAITLENLEIRNFAFSCM